MESLIALFESEGYELWESVDAEPGFQKVAIYADSEGPTHAAVQLPSGEWSSKLGIEWEDVAHESTETVGGRPGYGDVAAVLRRPRVGSEPVNDVAE